MGPGDWAICLFGTVAPATGGRQPENIAPESPHEIEKEGERVILGPHVLSARARHKAGPRSGRARERSELTRSEAKRSSRKISSSRIGAPEQTGEIFHLAQQRRRHLRVYYLAFLGWAAATPRLNRRAIDQPFMKDARRRWLLQGDASRAFVLLLIPRTQAPPIGSVRCASCAHVRWLGHGRAWHLRDI